MHKLTVLGCLLIACTIGAFGDAANEPIVTTINVGTRDQLQQAVRNAGPGTRILIAPGTYAGGLHWSGLQGTPDRPIVIAAAEASRPPVFQGGNSGLHLTQPRHLELRDLVLVGASGNGLNIDDGGSSDSPARGIALRKLQIRDVGPRGNRDGIKLSGVDDFRVEQCVIERWGDGGSGIDMVGCHRGEITSCVFRHRGDTQGNGVQTKGGSAEIAIRQCRFEDAGNRAVNLGGSTGRDYFRPKSPGYEARQITVEDCTFIGSMAAIAFVGVDGATVRYNTIYRPTRWIVRILQESQAADFVPCRNGTFSHNLIAFHAAEVRTVVNVGEGTNPQSFTFASNHWYCMDDAKRIDRLGLPVVETGGSYGQDPQFVDASKKDLRLQSSTSVRDAGARHNIDE